MLQVVSQFFPIFVFFGIGMLLRKMSLAEKLHGHFLLRLVFNVSLPLLIITTFSSEVIPSNKVILPFANIAICLACMLTTLLAIKVLKVERKAAGSMLVNTMMVNSMFALPFILTIYGDEGFIDSMLFNIGNMILMGTYIYVLACKYDGKEHESSALLKNVTNSPLLWALLLSVSFSYFKVNLPYSFVQIARPLADLTSPLIMIGMGILVSRSITFTKLVSLTVVIRMLMGMLFGVSIGAYLGLEDGTFIVVSLCAGAPIGINAMTYLSVAKLDADLSDKAVSNSIILGLLYMPLLIVLFGGV